MTENHSTTHDDAHGAFMTRAIQRAGRYADGFITAVSQIEEIDKTFRRVEQSWQEAGRSGKPRLVAQMEMALETHHIGQGRKNILDYYATLSPFDTYKSAALLTTEQQPGYFSFFETLMFLDLV